LPVLTEGGLSRMNWPVCVGRGNEMNILSQSPSLAPMAAAGSKAPCQRGEEAWELACPPHVLHITHHMDRVRRRACPRRSGRLP